MAGEDVVPAYVAAWIADRSAPPSIEALLDGLTREGWTSTRPLCHELGPVELDGRGDAARLLERLGRVAPLGLSIAPTVLGEVLTRDNDRYVVVRQPGEGPYAPLMKRPGLATDQDLDRAVADLQRLWEAGWRCAWPQEPGVWRVSEASGALVYDAWEALEPVDPRRERFDAVPIRASLALWVRDTTELPPDVLALVVVREEELSSAAFEARLLGEGWAGEPPVVLRYELGPYTLDARGVPGRQALTLRWLERSRLSIAPVRVGRVLTEELQFVAVLQRRPGALRPLPERPGLATADDLEVALHDLVRVWEGAGALPADDPAAWRVSDPGGGLVFDRWGVAPTPTEGRFDPGPIREALRPYVAPGRSPGVAPQPVVVWPASARVLPTYVTEWITRSRQGRRRPPEGPPTEAEVREALAAHGWREAGSGGVRFELGRFAVDGRHAEVQAPHLRRAPYTLWIAPKLLGQVTSGEARWVVLDFQEPTHVLSARGDLAGPAELDRAIAGLEILWRQGWRCPTAADPAAWRVGREGLVFDRWWELERVDPTVEAFDPAPIRAGLAPFVWWPDDVQLPAAVAELLAPEEPPTGRDHLSPWVPRTWQPLEALTARLSRDGWWADDASRIVLRFDRGRYAFDGRGVAQAHAVQLDLVRPHRLSIAPRAVGSVRTQDGSGYVLLQYPDEGPHPQVSARPGRADAAALDRALDEVAGLWARGWGLQRVADPSAWRVSEASGSLVYDRWWLDVFDAGDLPFDPAPIRAAFAPFLAT